MRVQDGNFAIPSKQHHGFDRDACAPAFADFPVELQHELFGRTAVEVALE